MSISINIPQPQTKSAEPKEPPKKGVEAYKEIAAKSRANASPAPAKDTKASPSPQGERKESKGQNDSQKQPGDSSKGGAQGPSLSQNAPKNESKDPSGTQGTTKGQEREKTPKESEAKAAPKAEAKAEQKPEVKQEKNPEPKAEAKAKQKPEPKQEPKESKAEAKPEPKQEAKQETKSEQKPEVKQEQKPEARAESKQETKQEQKPEPKTEARAERTQEPKQEPKAEQKVDQKAEQPKTEAKEAKEPKADSAQDIKRETFVNAFSNDKGQEVSKEQEQQKRREEWVKRLQSIEKGEAPKIKGIKDIAAEKKQHIEKKAKEFSKEFKWKERDFYKTGESFERSRAFTSRLQSLAKERNSLLNNEIQIKLQENRGLKGVVNKFFGQKEHGPTQEGLKSIKEREVGAYVEHFGVEYANKKLQSIDKEIETQRATVSKAVQKVLEKREAEKFWNPLSWLDKSAEKLDNSKLGPALRKWGLIVDKKPVATELSKLKALEEERKYWALYEHKETYDLLKKKEELKMEFEEKKRTITLEKPKEEQKPAPVAKKMEHVSLANFALKMQKLGKMTFEERMKWLSRTKEIDAFGNIVQVDTYERVASAS